MLESITVFASAIISALVALSVVRFQHRLERERLERDRRTERLAHYFAATHAAVLGMTELAYAPAAEKAGINLDFIQGPTERVNTRLAELRLLEPDAVVASAMALDRAMVVLHKMALDRQWDPSGWRSERMALTGAVDAFEKLVRRELLGKQPSARGQ